MSRPSQFPPHLPKRVFFLRFAHKSLIFLTNLGPKSTQNAFSADFGGKKFRLGIGHPDCATAPPPPDQGGPSPHLPFFEPCPALPWPALTPVADLLWLATPHPLHAWSGGVPPSHCPGGSHQPGDRTLSGANGPLGSKRPTPNEGTAEVALGLSAQSVRESGFACGAGRGGGSAWGVHRTPHRLHEGGWVRDSWLGRRRHHGLNGGTTERSRAPPQSVAPIPDFHFLLPRVGTTSAMPRVGLHGSPLNGEYGDRKES